ncbi:MAG: alpha/beta hydrolase [Bacteroidales bacterium]|nr:alpha/beta hydrolase [Bacteroidales bacterium]
MGSFHNYMSGRIHYRDRGSGSVVVLIHGYLETSEIWGDFAFRLAERYRVISVDLPGHGMSDIFGEEHLMDFMAAVISDLMDDLTVNKAFIAGHSMGGYVTLAFASLFPQRISGLCLFHSHPFADSPEVAEKRLKEIEMVKKGMKNIFLPVSISKMYAEGSLTKFPEAIKLSREIALSVPSKGIIAVLNGMMKRPSRLEVLESGTIPFLWILGARDNYMDAAMMLKRVKLPENAKAVILENSGHMGFIEEEDLTLKLFTEFLERNHY